MYTTITLAAFAVVLVLIIQTIRREQSQDRLFYAALGAQHKRSNDPCPLFPFYPRRTLTRTGRTAHLLWPTSPVDWHFRNPAQCKN